MPPRSVDLLAHPTAHARQRRKFFELAGALHDPDRLRELHEKAAVGGNVLSDLGETVWAESIAAFIASIRHRNLLDAIAEWAAPIPPKTSSVLTSSGIIASATDEAAAKVVRHLDLTIEPSDVAKVAALVVVSKELAESQDPAARRLFEGELETAVINASNAAVMNVLDIDTIGATGNVVGDLEAALEAVEDSSGYVVAADGSLVRQLALAYANEGTLGVNGGLLLPGLRVVVVADAPLTVIPAGRMALRDEGLDLATTSQADIQMSDTPSIDSDTPTPAQLTSMWQTNMIAIRAERRFRLFDLAQSVQVTDESL